MLFPTPDASQEKPARAPEARAGTSRFDGGRRAFLATLSGALVATLVVQITGCNTADPVSSGAPPGDGNNCGLGKVAVDRTGAISANHGHVAVVTTAQQDAGVAFNLSIQGSGNHDHIVALTTQDVAALKAGNQVVKTSSNVNGHTHTVTFTAVTTGIRPAW